MVNTAKAMLTSEKVKVNTHRSIIKDFDEKFVKSGRLLIDGGFDDLALQINKREPTKEFAEDYLNSALVFLDKVELFRKEELEHA